jgi:hypothetical protein
VIHPTLLPEITNCVKSHMHARTHTTGPELFHFIHILQKHTLCTMPHYFTRFPQLSNMTEWLICCLNHLRKLFKLNRSNKQMTGWGTNEELDRVWKKAAYTNYNKCKTNSISQWVIQFQWLNDIPSNQFPVTKTVKTDTKYTQVTEG